MVFAIIIFFSFLYSTLAAEQIISKSGITIGFPDDWIAITDENEKQEAFKDKAEFYKANKNIDFNLVEIYACDTTVDDFIENISVFIIPGFVPQDDSSITDFKNNIRDDYANLGVDSNSIKVKRDALNERDMLIVEFKKFDSLSNQMVVLYQAYIFGLQNIFAISCAVSEGGYDHYLPIFQEVFRSVSIIENISGKVYRRSVWEQIGIMVVVIGVILLIFTRFKKRNLAQKEQNIEE